MKKKILFVCYGLGIGGIEKCLVNLINVLPEEDFGIDLLLMNPEYTLKSSIRREVNCLDSFQYVMNTTDTFPEIQRRGGIVGNLHKTVTYCRFRVAVKLKRSSWKLFETIPVKYDIAIAYSQNDDSPYYVIDKVSAERKILWYHNGTYEADEKKYSKDKRYYAKFDHIVAVSTDCAKVLKARFHFSEHKLIVLRNICDVDEIRAKAQEPLQEEYKRGYIHIVTVGRLTVEKGADLALKTCRKLLMEGYDICWHWVGDGNQREKIQKYIKDFGLESNFILEGNQINPYPYIKAADIYVQPSYYEAYSTTVTEARMLKKPIVTTDVGGMKDQISNGINGIIVPIDADSIANGIKKYIDDKTLQSFVQRHLREDYFRMEDVISEYYKTVLG